MRTLYIAAVIARNEIAWGLSRTIYLVCAIAVAVSAWLGLSALVSPFMANPSDGISVRNVRQGDNLPLRYAERIKELAGVDDVAWMNFLPLLCNPSTPITLNAYDGPGTDEQLKQVGVSSDQLVAFHADPIAILVGARLAGDCGWHAGMTAEPPDAFDHPTEVHVVGVYHSDKSWGDQIAFAHYAYINRLMLPQQRDRAQIIVLRADRADDALRLASHIESVFADADPPVEADTGATEARLAQFGNVQALLAFVMLAVLLCTTLVLVNVWAHAAAQRRLRMATLQSLGFPRSVLFSGFVVECAAVAMLGTAAGIGLGLVVVHSLAPRMEQVVGLFAVPRTAYLEMPIWLAALMVTSLIAPAVIAARTHPAAGRHG